MPSRRDKIFEELGLLDQPEPVNPYGTLGIDPDFARELLKEDPSGEAIKVVATGMYRVLSQRYHPDKPTQTANPERFREIEEARNRIHEAPTSSLTRWSKVERSSTSSQFQRLQTDHAALLSQIGNVLQANFESVGNPRHFSQFAYAQGALLQRGESVFLMTRTPHGSLKVVPGRSSLLHDKVASADLRTQLFDFHNFMAENKAFGLPPGTNIRTFIDAEGRASILNTELSFLMDITGPVHERQRRHGLGSTLQQAQADLKSQWMPQTATPVLLTTTIASDEQLAIGNPHGDTALPPVQLLTFPDITGQSSRRNLSRELDMEVIGGYQNSEFYNRIKFSRSAGRTALMSGNTSTTFNYFNLVSVNARNLLEQDAGYTPLVQAGSGLMLYDPSHNMPVVTDVTILGIIGSNSRSITDW